MKWYLFATVLLSSAGLVVAASPVFSLESNDAIKHSASILAWDMLQYYKGNLSGGTPGILPGPPPHGDYYWWEGGAMWGTLIDYWAATGDASYNGIITQALQFQVGEGRDYMPRNVTASLGNDDQAFWAMAALSAAETRFPDPPPDQPGWLALAQTVFRTQASPQRHDETCGGGLRWQIPLTNSGYGYKNSIANGCFFDLAARLARYTGDTSYVDWAEKTWDWVEKIGFIDPDTYAIYDGGNIDHDCKDTNLVQYTYNNAIFAHGAAFMYNLTNGSQKWKTRLDKLITYGLSTFFPQNIALEICCEPNNGCKTDMFTYKGFLHRWYATVAQMAPFTAERIRPVLRVSARAAVEQCNGGARARQCGLHWSNGGAWDGVTGVGQEMSVLAAVVSVLMGEGRPPVTKDTGGTSKGGPHGGGRNGGGGGAGDGEPGAEMRPITTGDRVGAGIVTLLILGFGCGMFGWMSFDAVGRGGS